MGYALMLGGTLGLYSLVRARGELLEPADRVGVPVAPVIVGHASSLPHLLLAIALIIVIARGVGSLCERFLRQPAVMGEIVAGLLVGPTVLGALSPAAYEALFPASIAPHLGVLANLGVVLFMFLVGLELDPRKLAGQGHTTLAISHASIVAPFLLGSVLALGLYPLYGNAGVGFTAFSLFVGVSMSVTAFPVLARILTDRRMQSTRLGTMALACAAVDDATAWCLLALASCVATSQTMGFLRTMALVLAYLVAMYTVARLLLRKLGARLETHDEPLSSTQLTLVLGILLLSAACTDAIGIHALFGAFVWGAILPHDGHLARQLRARMSEVVVVLLLPIFFAYSGMRTHIGLVSTARDWGMCGAVILVATLGKFGGTLVAARWTGQGWRESSALGILMNTRGLMELIVLNVGLDIGVLSPTLFAILVLMALVTTFMTTPVLDLLLRGGKLSEVTSAPSNTALDQRGVP